jgi:hypothetical protein
MIYISDAPLPYPSPRYHQRSFLLNPILGSPSLKYYNVVGLMPDKRVCVHRLYSHETIYVDDHTIAHARHQSLF